MAEQVVLISGASSGIGQVTAKLLSERGFKVFGTSRKPSGFEKIPGVEVLSLDVCSDESVSDCVGAVLKNAGRLDILVNNAGYFLNCAIEEATMEEVKAQFETNLFGAVRLIKAVMPIMREQGSGQIINISSGLGLFPLPFTGFYAASKFALEAYTETLRHEVKPFNIQVSLVEPAFIKTNFMQNTKMAANQIIDYDPWRQRVEEVQLKYVEKAIDPTLVAKRILGIIDNKSPRLRNIVGMDLTLFGGCDESYQNPCSKKQ